MAYQKTAPKRYLLEMIAALALMFAAGWFVGFVTRHTHDPVLITAAKLLPILPILLVAAAVMRFYRRGDELQRKGLLKLAAAGGALSLLVFVLLPVLHTLGFPPLPSRFAPLVIVFSLLICGLIFTFLSKRKDKGNVGALLHIAPFSLLLLGLAGYWLASAFLPLPHMALGLAMILFTIGILAATFYEIFVQSRDQ